MVHPIFQSLRGIHRRLRVSRVMKWGAIGLLAGSSLALLGSVTGLLAQQNELRWLGLAVGTGLAVISLVAAAVSPLPLRAAARAVDDGLQLKDRSMTALAFLQNHRESALHQLQVEDAMAHLSGVDAKSIVPFRWPQTLGYAVPVLVAAGVLALWPIHAKDLQASVAPPDPVIVEQAEILLEGIEKIEEFARESNDEELAALHDELKEQAESLKEQGVDVRQALAKLSEMENALLAQQAKYNVGLVDAQLASLGEAMSASKGLEGAGQSLQAGKFEEAAKMLEEMSPDSKMTQREAKATAEKMDRVAKAMADAGLGTLSQNVSETSQKLQEGGDKMCESCKGLAKCVSSHAKKKKLGDLLQSQCQSLSECKGNCQKNSLVRNRIRKKSDSPSQSYGLTQSGNTDGEKTDLLARRDLVRVTGTMGDGPSETETTHSPEGKQEASRSYREVYQQYQKMSEAVLDREPIPLGHRETIRRYFELIRPEGTQPEPSESSDQ